MGCKKQRTGYPLSTAGTAPEKNSQEGLLNEDSILAIMSEEKKPEKNDITLSGDTLRKYFPKSYTPMQMESTIIKLLESWQKKRQRKQAR